MSQKTYTGLIKRIYSASHIQLQGKVGKSGLPLERDLYIIGINVPKVSTSSEDLNEDSLGFEAREFLRSRVLSKHVDFVIETTAAGRELACISFEGKDLAILLLENGLAKVSVKFEGQEIIPKGLQEYRQAETNAKNSKKGIWADAAELNKNKRALQNVDFSKIFAKACKVQGICEEFSNATFSFYLSDHKAFLKFHLEGLTLPIINFRHQTELRIFVEERILQRDITLKISKFDIKANAAFGEPLLDNKLDLVKELIEQGFAKLTNEAVTELDISRFRVLKDAMEIARAKQIRIWKDFKASAKQNEKGKSDTYNAKVIEVHSGDSLSVMNLVNNEIKRIFLANIRAPSLGNAKKGEPEKPGALEAKDFLRKLLVGKQVKVEMEFVKTLQQKPLVGGEPNEKHDAPKSLEFATLFLGDKNVSESLLAAGLANVAMPRVDEEFTKYLKVLKDAEDKARETKQGLFSTQERQNIKYTDLTLKNNVAKAKQFYNFNQNEKRVPAIVELVLSGSRYKVRLLTQQTYIIFALQGVRTFPNDTNVKSYAENSAKALLFSKENLLQRDVELEFESFDNNGAICGSITLNKKNYAVSLLEAGLAFASKGGPKITSRYQDQYERAEADAKKNEIGIWANGQSLNLSTSRIGFKELKEKATLVCSEISSEETFYLQDTANKVYAILEKELANISEDHEERLKPPIKAGTPCLALFLEDVRWYRARIEKHVKGDKWLVFFIDYGNYDEVVLDDLRKMPNKLLNLTPLAKKCSLAYIKNPKQDSDIAAEAAEWLKARIFNNKLESQFCYQIEDTYYVILQEAGNTDPLKTVNAEILKKGFAKISHEIALPKELNVWSEIEEKAAEKGDGVWGLGEEDDEQEDY